MIYLDNAATTKVRDEVIDIMVKYLKENYGNPSSLYDFGYSVTKDINSCREVIAKQISIFETKKDMWVRHVLFTFIFIQYTLL